MLYVPKIYQNLLSVRQLIEKDYKVVFEDKSCLIKYVDGQDIFKVKMRGKSFALNPLEDEQIAFPIKENITEVTQKAWALSSSGAITNEIQDDGE